MATKWPEEVKQAVLADYLEIGPTAAAEKHGVPVGSVKGWAHRAGLSLPNSDRARWEREALLRHHELSVEQAEQHQAEWGRWLTEAQVRQERRRMELKDKLLDAANDLLDRLYLPAEDFKGKDATRVVYEVPDARSAVELVKAAAIAIDKFRLESGEVTDRTEAINLQKVDSWIAQFEQLEASLSDNDPRSTSSAGEAVPPA